MRFFYRQRIETNTMKFPKISPRMKMIVGVCWVLVVAVVLVIYFKGDPPSCTTNTECTNALPYCGEHKKCVECNKSSQCPSTFECKLGKCEQQKDGNEDRELVCDQPASIDRALCHNSLSCMYDTEVDKCVDRVMGAIKDCKTIKKDNRCRSFGGRCSWINKKCVTRALP